MDYSLQGSGAFYNVQVKGNNNNNNQQEKRKEVTVIQEEDGLISESTQVKQSYNHNIQNITESRDSSKNQAIPFLGGHPAFSLHGNNKSLGQQFYSQQNATYSSNEAKNYQSAKTNHNRAQTQTKQQIPPQYSSNFPADHFSTFDDFMAGLKNSQQSSNISGTQAITQFNPQMIQQISVIQTPPTKKYPQQQAIPDKREIEPQQLISFRMNPSSQKLNTSRQAQLIQQALTAAQRQQLRKKQKQRQQLQILKQKAVQKQRLFKIKREAAIKIQHFMKRFITWRKQEKAKLKQLAVNKLHILFNNGYHKTHTKLIKTVIYLILQALQKRESQRERLYQRYILHCATIIQSAWRGYCVRRTYKSSFNVVQFAKVKILSLAKGWKIRKIMKNTREIKNIIEKIRDLEMMDNLGDDMGYMAQLKTERSRKIIELQKMVEKLYVFGRWVSAKRRYQQFVKQQQQQQNHKNKGNFLKKKAGIKNQVTIPPAPPNPNPSTAPQYESKQKEEQDIIASYSNERKISQRRPLAQDERPIRPMKSTPFGLEENLQKTPSPQKLQPTMDHKKPHAQMTPLPNIQSNRSRGNSSGGDDPFTDRSLGNGPQLDMSRYDTAQKRSMIPEQTKQPQQYPLTLRQNEFNQEFGQAMMYTQGAPSYGNDNLMIGTLKKKNDIGALDQFLSQQELDRIKRQGEEKRRKIQQRKKNAKQNKKQVYDPKKALQVEEQKKKSGNAKVSSRLKGKIQESKLKQETKIKQAKSLLQQQQQQQAKQQQQQLVTQKQNEETNTSPKKQRIIKSCSNKYISPSNKDQFESQNLLTSQGEEQQQQQQQTNAANNRPFLKRKSQAVKFQKLNWNRVKKRIDCWNAGNNTGGFPIDVNTSASAITPESTTVKPMKEKKFLTQGGGQQASSIRAKNAERNNRNNQEGVEQWEQEQEQFENPRKKSNIPAPTSSIRQHNNPNQRRNQQVVGGSVNKNSKSSSNNSAKSTTTTGPSSKERGKQKGLKLASGQISQESRIPRLNDFRADKRKPSQIQEEDQFYQNMQEQIKISDNHHHDHIKKFNYQYDQDQDEIPSEYMEDMKSQKNDNFAMITMGHVKGPTDYQMDTLLQKSDFWQDQMNSYHVFGSIQDLEFFYKQLHGGLFYQQMDGEIPESNENSRIPIIAQNSFFMRKYQQTIYDSTLEDLKVEYEELVGDYNQHQQEQQ